MNAKPLAFRVVRHAGHHAAIWNLVRINPSRKRKSILDIEPCHPAAINKHLPVKHTGETRAPENNRRIEAPRRRPVKRRAQPPLPLLLLACDRRLLFPKPILHHARLLFDRCQRRLLRLRRCRNHWLRIAVLHRPALLRNIIEVREDLVKLLLRERIVFMVVTPRAAQRRAQKHRRRSLDAVHHILHRVLLGNNPVFSIRSMVAIEPRRHFLFERRVRQHVSRNLIASESIEWQVAIERIDHPIPPSPHHPLAVVLITVGVRIPRGIQPAKRHPLPITGRAEQTIHNLLISVCRPIRQKRIDLRGRRRQPRQIERNTPDQRLTIRLSRGLHSFSLELLQNESVDRHRILEFRNRRPNRRNKRPVLLPLRALIHPLAQRCNLRCAQRKSRRHGRHPQRRL